MNNLLLDKGIKAKKAARVLANIKSEDKDRILFAIAEELENACEQIIESNKLDCAAAKNNGLSTAMQDRLMLDRKRIVAMADSVRQIAKLPDPVGIVMEGKTLPNGLELTRRSVPLGVVGIIYESRPNVTIDCSVLCIKSGNACVLRGGKEAINSNKKLIEVVHRALEKSGISKDVVQLVEDTDRKYAEALMELVGYVDVLIPRGGKALIQSVLQNAKVPVIETGSGVCHVYVDEFANLDMAIDIVENAKTSRPSVCNALETLLVHEKVADKFLPMVKNRLKNVKFKACNNALNFLGENVQQASADDWSTEYNDYMMNVRVVQSMEQALEHIAEYSTGHSEAIITDNYENSQEFLNTVDAAAVYVNASTRFTDGGEFGLGAEIGIATQKMHVRGPMGLQALTSSKYIIRGNGQVRA